VQTTPAGHGYSITGAPRIVKGNVVIGNGGAEYGVRGYVTAYDAETGRQVWRWYTVPGNPADGFENDAMRKAAATWTGEWWKIGGGGTVWDGMAYDPELDLLYVGTGNGSPWNRDHRSPGGGDNLYLSSIVALRGATGEYVWHYQTTPGDDWDYTATQPLMLLDLTIGGRSRKTIVQAPKNGFFYVIDRVTGEFISAQPFADVITWAKGIDQKTAGPSKLQKRATAKPAGVWLSPERWVRTTGADGVQPGNRPRLPADEQQQLLLRTRAARVPARQWNTGVSFSSTAQRPERPTITSPATSLKAWDPVRNAEVWSFPSITSDGGVLSTGGNLVFWGVGSHLRALDARSGAQLWGAEIGSAAATPVTYELDGRQYVTILAGRSGQSPARVWTFGFPK
jgi:PQQ-dependent dehydrogenase (methanol/ethanol family)